MSAAQFEQFGFRAAFTGVSFRAESWFDPDLEHAPATGAYSLTADQGTYTLTGQAAALLATLERLLAGSVGGRAVRPS